MVQFCLWLSIEHCYLGKFKIRSDRHILKYSIQFLKEIFSMIFILLELLTDYDTINLYKMFNICGYTICKFVNCNYEYV